MSFANNPTLSEREEPEQHERREHVELGPRGPRVHFINHVPPVARSSNERASPQRFTNPFNGDELEPDKSMSDPALDGVTLYHTQLPLNGSGTLEANGNHLELNQGGNFPVELPPTRDRYLWSSHQHPYEIEPPSRVYDDATFGPRRYTVGSLDSRDDGVGGGSARRLSSRYSIQDPIDVSLPPMPRRFRGGFANMLELWRVYSQRAPEQSEFVIPGDTLFGNVHSRPWLVRSSSSFGYDPDDPKLTGLKKMSQEDPDDAESQCKQQMNLQYMSYRQRRKEAQKIKIQFNVTSILNRQQFIMKLARCLMAFGAPSHRIESQLIAAARILEVDAEFIHLPNLIIVCFGDPETKTSETHFLRCSGRLALGSLHKVHRIYRRVVHDEMSARRATEELMRILESAPIYGLWTRCFIAFWLSALICPLAFGGSFLDMFVAGMGAFVLSALQLTVVMKSSLYANVFEITIGIFISLLARGVSSLHSRIFCYSAISSAGIVGILPGYLILSSSLELASKNILCGSVKMVYALIYTLFLGFGLQIGSDLYLLFDVNTRHQLDSLNAAIARTVVYTGSYVIDNGTLSRPELPSFGSFTFTNGSTPSMHMQEGCYRPPDSPWYLQPFPFWSQFITVPLFSILSSLSNLQPWRELDLVVMVIISCISFAANKAANHFIFNRSDVVSAIGAFAVGLLGNIYSRMFSGTAFTVMVTGVLFLVPSGLSQAGGGAIAASGNGIDIGSAMIAVTIGITVRTFHEPGACVHVWNKEERGYVLVL
ncbi:hypothetical protein F5888DRAFT_1650573, partial [Russula emetica]